MMIITGESNIVKSKLIVVEGKAEVKLFEALGYEFDVPDFQIIDIDGVSNYRSKISLIAKSPNFSRVTKFGLVRDADNNPQSTIQSIRDALRSCKLTAPTASLQPVGEKPQVSFLVLPDDYHSGMLEDVCLNSVQDEPAMVCVEEFCNCMIGKKVLQSRNIAKTKLHAFLASREKPDLTIGFAALAGYFPLSHPAFERARNFLTWYS